jgi:hypothetical protein
MLRYIPGALVGRRPNPQDERECSSFKPPLASAEAACAASTCGRND